MKTRFAVEQRMDAPADVIYHCLLDYREHHRPGGFLPTAFSDQRIVQGGVGDGTELLYDITVGGRRRAIHATVKEAIAGHQLVESAHGIESTMTVEPLEDGARVRFETKIDESGVTGLVNRLFAARLLTPIYRDELQRLEAYAQAHTPSDS
jgi:Polyketide cyclase / dehydrase and lipid transport